MQGGAREYGYLLPDATNATQEDASGFSQFAEFLQGSLDNSLVGNGDGLYHARKVQKLAVVHLFANRLPNLHHRGPSATERHDISLGKHGVLGGFQNGAAVPHLFHIEAFAGKSCFELLDALSPGTGGADAVGA